MRLPLTLTVVWAAFWLTGSWWTASDLEAAIQTSADRALRESGAILKRVNAEAAGDRVILSGMVSREGDMQAATQRLRARLRLPNAWGLSRPEAELLRVESQLSVDRKPFGWGLLTVNASKAQLFGVTGSLAESGRIESLLRPALAGGPELTSHLDVDPDRVQEHDQTPSRLETAEGFTREALAFGLVAVTRWDGSWQVLDLNRPFEQIRKQCLATGAALAEWEETISGVVRAVQDARKIALSTLQEQRRLSALPAGHVVLAVRADTVLIKGELGSPQATNLLREATERSIGSRRLVNELLHDPQRRFDNDVRKLATEMPALPVGNAARLLAVGTLEAGWRVLNLKQIDVEDANSILPGMLPAGSDRRLMIGDIAAAAGWIFSIDSAPSAAPAAKPTAYLFLVLVGHQALLYGAVPDEALRVQTQSAVRQRYPALEVISKLRVDPHSTSGETPLITLGALPAHPGAETSGLLALAFLGEEWRTKPARASLLEAPTLAQSGLLPATFSVNVLMPDLLDASGVIRSHLKLHEQTSPPGIPLQIIGPR